MTPETIPYRLANARASANLTQEQAGAQLDVPRHTFARWERGEMTPGKYTMPTVLAWLENMEQGEKT